VIMNRQRRRLVHTGMLSAGCAALPRAAFSQPSTHSQRTTMSRTIISTTKAPAAVGTYSQAVKVGSTVYVSGQIPLDPATGQLVEGPIDKHIQRVFANLQAIIEAAGGSFADVVKLNVFLTDLANFATLNKIMAEYFQEPYPARAAIQVAALPKGAQVEMDCVVELG
jgi:reactive intermediate/imine deaminase